MIKYSNDSNITILIIWPGFEYHYGKFTKEASNLIVSSWGVDPNIDQAILYTLSQKLLTKASLW